MAYRGISGGRDDTLYGDSTLHNTLSQLTSAIASVQRLVRQADVPRKRDPEKVVIVDGACPNPLRGCDPEEEARKGRTCPDIRRGTTDPLIIDDDKNICYAPAAIEAWAGKANLASVDTLIERAASELLRLISSNDALLHKVKEVALQSAVVKVTKAQPLGANAYKDNAFDMNNRVIQAQELDADTLQEGLRAAQEMFDHGFTTSGSASPLGSAAPSGIPRLPPPPPNPYASGSSRTAPSPVVPVPSAPPAIPPAASTNPLDSVEFGGGGTVVDWVFRNFQGRPMKTVVSDIAAGRWDNTPSPNANTIAYAGAYAWAKRADAIAAAAGTDKPTRFVSLVTQLPQRLHTMMDRIVDGADRLPASLVNLSFRWAWPLIMTGRVGLTTLERAAASVTREELMEAAGETDKAAFEADFGKKTAGQQWAEIVAVYMAR